jgi:N-acetyl-anhydromuramyl-L-alanine amidase AmpD
MVDINRDLSKIDTLIIHCSASDKPFHDNFDEVKRWHMERGWIDIGYHYFIDKKGMKFDGRPLTKVGAHCAGHNMTSIGICLSGKYEFYECQFRTALFLITDLMRRYNIPRSRVYPHNYFDAGKTCPNFEMSKIWSLDK